MISTLPVIYWHVVQSVDSGDCGHKLINRSSLFSYLSLLPNLTLSIMNWLWFFFFSPLLKYQSFRYFQYFRLGAVILCARHHFETHLSRNHLPFLGTPFPPRPFNLHQEDLRQNHDVMDPALALQRFPEAQCLCPRSQWESLKIFEVQRKCFTVKALKS